MSVISGIGGAVNGQSTVRTWTVTSLADIQAIIASGSKQGTVLVAGNTDWNGNFTAYGDTPAVMPNEGFTFTGSVDGTKGVTGTAIVDSVEIVIDVETGAVIAYTVNFSGNGVLTLGAAVATDTSKPCPATSIGTKVELGTLAAVFTEIDDVRTVTITITADNQSYVSSATAGGTKRVAGNISASISITVFEGDPANLPAANDEGILRLFVNASEFWEFKFIRFADASDVGVDVEAGAVVGATLNAQWSAFAEVSSVCTEGSIKKPDASTYWPLS